MLVHVSRLTALFICLFQSSLGQDSGGDAEDENTALIDHSWPMQSFDVFQQTTDNLPQQRNYEAFMQGCYKSLGEHVCNKNEKDRLGFNRVQPPLMRNFTAAGYAKVATPDATQQILTAYLDKFQKNLDLEDWGAQSYVNHWEAEVDTHNIEFFMPVRDRQRIQQQVKQVLESWCGVPLTPTSMYGIRVYRKGSILASHVDRLPLVISAILNVAQDQDAGEDWPLEVIGHDGKAVNLTLQPGEMILYESHSIIHGRPYPLDKWYFANIFLHFEPVGFSYELKQNFHNAQREQPPQTESEIAQVLFHQALEKPPAERRRTTTFEDFPAYITASTDQEKRWKQDFIFHREPSKPINKPKRMADGATTAHSAAATGNLEALKLEAQNDPSVLNKADVNGWQPIHEAARAGHTKVLEYLIAKGIDVNERTHNGKGASALWWAERNLAPNHPAVALLKKHGAVAKAPKEE